MKGRLSDNFGACKKLVMEREELRSTLPSATSKDLVTKQCLQDLQDIGRVGHIVVGTRIDYPRFRNFICSLKGIRNKTVA